MRFPALLQNSPFPTLVGAFSLDEALGLQFGQMLLYGFVGNTDDFGQFTGGVFRMGFEQGNDFLPTFQKNNGESSAPTDSE